MGKDELRDITDPKIISVRTEKRIKQLTDFGLVETDEKDFAYNALTLVSNETIQTSDDEGWKSTISLLNEVVYTVKEVVPEDDFVFPTDLDKLNPEVIDNTSDVEQINVIDEEEVTARQLLDVPNIRPYLRMSSSEPRFNPSKMTYEEKVFTIHDWVTKCEEHELDNIINQYLN